MKQMFKYLKPYRVMAIMAPLFMLLEVGMDLLQPIFMERIVDVGVANGDIAYVGRTLAYMLGIAIVGFVGGAGCSILAAKSSVSAGTDLRKAAFEKVQTLSFSNIDKFETGNLITRLTSDINQVQQLFMQMQRIMVRAPFMVIGSLIMTWFISPKLFMILLVMTPILIVTMVIVIRKGYPLYKEVQKKLDRVNTVMQENLAGIRVVKAFVRRDFEEKRFEKANEDYMNRTVKVGRISAIMTPVMMLTVNIGIVFVLWFGHIEVTAGQLQVGKVMAFINYLTQLMNSLMMVGNLTMNFSRAQASAERVAEIFKESPKVIDKKGCIEFPKKSDRKLVFDHVYFSYGDHAPEPVLKDISFVASQGEKIAIIGSTGSGKSTLVNLIPRLYDVTSGTISVGGVDIRNMDRHSLRKNIGMVLQQSILFSGTILDNILYGKKDGTVEEVEVAATMACADEFINDHEEGYETILGQKGVNLSGGQKQRLSIARGLIRKPSILIFDDSTSAVDVTTEAIIQDGIKVGMDETIVIMVAQRISSVLDADCILVLEEGRLVAKGTHDELIANSETYKEIYVSQLGEEGVA